jgi:hypothetical protein
MNAIIAIIKSIFDDSQKHTFVYGVSLAFYLSIVWFGSQPHESFTDSLFRAGYLWIIFGLYFLIFALATIWKLKRSKK